MCQNCTMLCNFKHSVLTNCVDFAEKYQGLPNAPGMISVDCRVWGATLEGEAKNSCQTERYKEDDLGASAIKK